MEIQSLSICVPAPCLNDCSFCVSKMHREEYQNMLDENLPFYDLYLADYRRRLEFARDNGCNTVMLTGSGEPILNKEHLKLFGTVNRELSRPFRWIELQTSGTKLDEQMLRFLRNHVQVSTISLSLSDVFDSSRNAEMNRTKAGFEVDIDASCSLIKRYDFNLRLSLNMTDVYTGRQVLEVFDRAKALGADQVTFRVLYETQTGGTDQDRWIQQHRASPETLTMFTGYVKDFGRPLEVLPFGATRYALRGMSVVIDDDCMNVQSKTACKYLILRPDCHLYSRWDEKGSLVF